MLNPLFTQVSGPSSPTNSSPKQQCTWFVKIFVLVPRLPAHFFVCIELIVFVSNICVNDETNQNGFHLHLFKKNVTVFASRFTVIWQIIVRNDFLIAGA